MKLENKSIDGFQVLVEVYKHYIGMDFCVATKYQSAVKHFATDVEYNGGIYATSKRLLPTGIKKLHVIKSANVMKVQTL